MNYYAGLPSQIMSHISMMGITAVMWQNDTAALCEIDLCEDEWQSIFEEPLALQFEEWNDKQKEEALNEALQDARIMV